jgi:hypothetical protein
MSSSGNLGALQEPKIMPALRKAPCFAQGQVPVHQARRAWFASLTSGGPTTSSIIRTAVRNTRRSLSAIAARKLAFIHRQAWSATPTTMRCAKVSSPPSNASSTIGVASDLTAKRGHPSFGSSKASTIARCHSALGYLSPIEYERKHDD